MLIRCRCLPLPQVPASVVWLWMIVVAGPVAAQLPTSQLSAVFPSGAQAGAALEVTISGTNLDDADQLTFSHPGIRAKPKMAEATPFDETPPAIENVFEVTVAPEVPKGRYEVRMRGKYGLSNPRAFQIGSLQEFSESEPNGRNELPEWSEVDDGEGKMRKENPANEIQVPAIINGQSASGADVDWFRFQGQRGQRIMFDGFARRIDSEMDLSMTLIANNGNVVGEARPGVCGDPIMDAKLPDDGVYFLKIHDALFRNGVGYHYRIRIGTFPYIDYVFPPAAKPGASQEFTIYGTNLPSGVESSVSVDGYRLEMAKMKVTMPDSAANLLKFSSMIAPHQAAMDGIEFRMEKDQEESNPVLITVATAPTVLEVSDNDLPDRAQKLTPPVEVAGQFYPQRDVDWYSFDAKKDEVWAIDLYSQRLGTNTDPTLLIQRVTIEDSGEETIRDIQFIDDVRPPNVNNKSGKHEFDVSSTDPSYLFVVPEDGTYRVLVREGISSVKSDPRLIYRLAIRKPEPDYRIVAVPGYSSGSLLLRRGGRQLVRVFVIRSDGFDGEIKVACAGLPKGVTTDEIVVGPGNIMGTLILTASDDAPVATSALTVTSKAMIGGKEVVREARYGNALRSFRLNQPNANIPSVPARLVDGIQLCVTDDEVAPMKLTIGDGDVLETSRGGKLKIPYVVKRVKDASGNLNAFPIDFPSQSRAANVNIGSNEKGEFELSFLAATPPGTYTLYLAGFNQGYSYRRNPELMERAKQRQERIAGILDEASKKTQAAQQQSNQMQSQVQTATNALNQAKQDAQRAEQTFKTAESEAQQAEATVKQKKKEAAEQPDNEALKTQTAKAEADLAEATNKRDQAKKMSDEATRKQQMADTSLQEAQQAKTKADEELQAARDFQQSAQQEKQKADQFFNQKRNESNPRNININVPSNSLNIKIAEFPIQVEVPVDNVIVKQGEKTEVSIGLKRLYGFEANVSVQTQVPAGVGGVNFQALTLQANQSEGKFEINTQANATPGIHECTVRFQMNFNGQNLTLEQPLKIEVLEVQAEKS